MKKIIIISFVLLIVAATAWWVYNSSGLFLTKQLTPPNQDVGEVINHKELRVGIDPTYFPMESFDNNQNVIGFDADFAREIAKEFGVPVKFKSISFDKIFDELKAGDIDVIISSITITLERAKTMSFSKPYFNAGQVIVTLKDNNSIKNTLSLQGKKIGVQAGTTSETEANKFTAAKLVMKYADYDVATKKLLSGNIDALIMDFPAAVGKVKENSQLIIVGVPFTQEFYGVVVSKEKEGLLAPINKVITQLIETGELKKLESKWLK